MLILMHANHMYCRTKIPLEIRLQNPEFLSRFGLRRTLLFIHHSFTYRLPIGRSQSCKIRRYRRIVSTVILFPLSCQLFPQVMLASIMFSFNWRGDSLPQAARADAGEPANLHSSEPHCFDPPPVVWQTRIPHHQDLV